MWKVQGNYVANVLRRCTIKYTKKMLTLMRNHKRIILVGKAASGKDHLRKKFESRGFKYAVSYTTRPPREGEVDGKDYFFLTEELASKMVESGMFYEYVHFNGWLYGTTVEQFYMDDLFIMTPAGISHIKPEDRLTSFIIYTDIDIETREIRLKMRYMPGDSLERRIQADEVDFTGFNDYDLRITNEDF
jgi:guanylate kinase